MAKRKTIRRIISPFQTFFQQEASSGILLIIATVIALVWANSNLKESYFSLWHTDVSIIFGTFEITKDLLLWINDGLMAVFFFVVGLEIKREVLVGELASRRKAILPIVAAIGGMVVPAALFIFFNRGGPAQSGWGIPMATDIAFAIGILSLLGNRVPLSLKVFITAVAIVDDLGAVLVIALFYTSEIDMGFLLFGGIIYLLLIIMSRLHVRSPILYGVLGLFLWVAFLKSGVHATIAGVLLAVIIPVRTRINTEEFLERAVQSLEKFKVHGKTGESVLTNREQRSAIHALEVAAEQAQTPLHRMEHSLHPWVVYVIMPIFALANAGINLSEINGGNILAAFGQPVTLGVMAGLIFGKQIGIFGASYIAVKLGWSDLPAGMTWARLYGLACLAGIGFTMSLFIAGLAFGEPELLDMSKVGILVASLISGSIGAFVLSRGKK
ncbi:MAG: Na+/H+ antiporter NhaA [Anaerolineales bacterium]|nr:Na+/H+ antiporter NhaA [Anaerolineales bacterium]